MYINFDYGNYHEQILVKFPLSKTIPLTHFEFHLENVNSNDLKLYRKEQLPRSSEGVLVEGDLVIHDLGVILE